MNAPQVTQPNLADIPPPNGEVAVLLGGNHDFQTLPFPNTPTSQVRAKPAPSSTVTLPPSSAAPVLVMALNARWQTYCDELHKCQRNFSEEAMHQLRVASRRLVAQLIMLSCVIQGPEADQARRLLKRRLKALSALRDVHVLGIFAQRQTRRFPELLLLRHFLQRKERRLEKAVAVKVKSFKTRKLERWILRLGQDLTRQAARAKSPEYLGAAAIQATESAYREVVRRREAIDPETPKTVHRTRLAFKRFRYMVEALSPDFTGLQRNELRALARYQRRMGNLQDLEVVQSCVADFVRQRAKLEPLMRPFYSYLQRRRRHALQSFLKSADDLYDFWPPLARQNGHRAAALSAA